MNKHYWHNQLYPGGGSRFGGKIANGDYPDWENNLRSVLYPEYRRLVEVRITTYMGICFEATHYFVGFDIESDEILLLEEDGKFTECTPHDFPHKYCPRRMDHLDFIDKEPDYDDDADDYWETFKDKFKDLEFAIKWARETAIREFPEDKFIVEFDKEYFG